MQNKMGCSVKPKRILCFLLVIAALAGLSACAKTGDTVPQDSAPEQQVSLPEQTDLPTEDTRSPETEPTVQEPNILVAYFSATGTTKAIAERISAESGGTLQEITPAQPYTPEDLSYQNDDCRANQEQNDPDARPEISGNIANIDEYDVLFLGYPIWWGGLPKIIYTFLENNGLDGKIIVPFCTSGGSGIDGSVREIRALVPNADVKDGRRFSSSESDSDISEWIQGLDIPMN